MVCSPTLETKGIARFLNWGNRRWSSGRPNHRRPGHQGARVSGTPGRGGRGELAGSAHCDRDEERRPESATIEDRRGGSGFTGGGACGGEERDAGARVGDGQPQGLSGRFYRAMRGRRGHNREQWPWGLSALIAFKGKA
jgi:hypothetical protein